MPFEEIFYVVLLFAVFVLRFRKIFKIFFKYIFAFWEMKNWNQIFGTSKLLEYKYQNWLKSNIVPLKLFNIWRRTTDLAAMEASCSV